MSPENVTGDKVPDLIVTHVFGSTLSSLKGNGDRPFQTEQQLRSVTNVGSQCLQLSDLNGDGKQDLVITSGNNIGVAVLIGNGDGSFQLPVAYRTGGQLHVFTIGDVNGDGNLDLNVPDAAENIVTVLLGNGDGSFSPRSSPCRLPPWSRRDASCPPGSKSRYFTFCGS